MATLISNVLFFPFHFLLCTQKQVECFIITFNFHFTKFQSKSKPLDHVEVYKIQNSLSKRIYKTIIGQLQYESIHKHIIIKSKY